MSHVRVNGRGAFWGELRMPRVGAWEGDFGVSREGDVALEGPVTIEIGPRTWRGTSWRSGENRGALYVRVVGGAGGLSDVVAPRAYQGVPLSIPVNDLLREVGETLSPSADAGLLGAVVAKWNRTTQPAGLALVNLLEAAGATWRVLADGTVWIGRETWPASALAEYTYLRQAPNAGALDIFAADPAVFPGELFLERRVSVVTHRLDSSSVRTRILWEEEQRSDRLKDGVLALVRSAFPAIDFLAGYWCRVVAQNADGTLELQPDDPRIAGLSNVAIRYGVPAVKATVAAGARVLLEFAGGDPSQPYATVWEAATPSEIVIGPGASQPAALATALRTELDAIWSALQTHVHPVATTGTASAQSGTASAATVEKTAQPIASPIVKVSA